jgi:hypothetical protein
MGRSIVLMLGQEPRTTKFWFNIERANSRVLVVKNKTALGILSTLN